ncbi:hypothetical protein F5B19DRAFT_489615 [Rostrohypoxylon terebratum]|nr:hypothetical protein F5B19DRAFT_489615 [Rostrohypoxylon terebratum]
MDFGFQGILGQHSRHMEIGFNYVFDAILKHSKVDISLIRISNVTETSIHVSFEARVSNTGPAKATLSPMTIELCGPAGPFGKITLPEFNTTPGGAYFAIQNQYVEITNKTSLVAFVSSVLNNKSVTLSLKNGQGAITVAAFGIGPRSLPYERDIALTGMNLTSVTVVRASTSARPSTSSNLSTIGSLIGSRSHLTVTFNIKNLSPVELSFSICEFEIRNWEDEIIAALKGRLDMRSEDFDVTLYGAVDKRLAPTLEEGRVRLVGKRCAGAGWCDMLVKSVDLPILHVWKLRQALDLPHNEPKPEPPKVSRWHGWFVRRSQS